MFWRRILVMPSSIQFLNGFLCILSSENQIPNDEKSLKYIRKIVLFWLQGYIIISSLPYRIFTPTWLNIASLSLPKPTKIASWMRLEPSWACLGGRLGRLGRDLERLGLILERLGASWRRLGASWARLEASGVDYVKRRSGGGALLWRRGHPFLRGKNLFNTLSFIH